MMHLSVETFGLNPWAGLAWPLSLDSLSPFHRTVLLPLTLNSGRDTFSAFSRPGSDPWLTMHRYAELT